MATTLVQITIVLCLDSCMNCFTALFTFILSPFQHISQKKPRAMYKFNHGTFILGASIDFLLYLKWNPSTGMICPSLHLQSHHDILPLGHKASATLSQLSFFRFQFRDPILRDHFSYHLNRLHILISFSFHYHLLFFLYSTYQNLWFDHIFITLFIVWVHTRIISLLGKEICHFYSLSSYHSPYYIAH